MGLQRLGARPAVRDLAQLAVERLELDVDLVDQSKRDLDPGARRVWELEPFEPGAPLTHEQVASRRVAVMEELCVDALLPAGALLDQRPAQAHERAQLEDLLGRDPRPRHAPLLEQLA